MCPAGGADCVVTTVTGNGAESTGPAPSLEHTTNEIVWQANNGPAGTSDGAHALGLEGRLIRGAGLNQTNPLLGSGPSQQAQRQTAAVNNTRATGSETMRTVTPTASWASGATNTAPTLGLTVSGTGTSSFAVDGDSDVPSLGAGWNGAALSKTATISSIASTARAVIYSDITQQPSGGSADTFYMLLGAWLVMPDSSTAASTAYNMGSFAHASSGLLSSTNTIAGLTGTMSYTGPATGLYSKATYSAASGSRALESATIGSFTATATISANFGTGTSAISGLSGTVTNFMENGQSLGSWTINLPSTTGSSSMWGALYRGGAPGSGSAADGLNFTTGNWSVQFHRSGSTGLPDLAVGTFSASTAPAADDALHIVGAYAAD